jgi:hypothetical protein
VNISIDRRRKKTTGLIHEVKQKRKIMRRDYKKQQIKQEIKGINKKSLQRWQKQGPESSHPTKQKQTR